MIRPQWVCRHCLSRARTTTASRLAVARPNLAHNIITRRQSHTSTRVDEDEDFFLAESLLKRAKHLATEHDVLERQLMEDFDTKTAARAGHLRPVSEALKEYEAAVENLKELRVLASDPESDLSAMAADDIPPTIDQIRASSTALTTSLVPRHQFAAFPCTIEIRPGTGGSEATLFANDLYKMYNSLLSNLRWQSSVISYQTHNEIGGEGCSEAIISVSTPESYDLLRHEAGVHRVQRIPATENKGRTHTSTASVMVLPKLGDEEGDFEYGTDDDPLAQIDMKDVKTDVMRASGAGGQHVNRTESAVRMTHIPTGIVVAIQDSRSQHKNRSSALTILKAKVAEKRRKEKEEEALSMRRGVVKVGAGRSDKIRTYNFTQNRVTDHRSGQSNHDLPRLMEGDGLIDMIEGVQEWDKQRSVEVMLALQEMENLKKEKK
ncbi:hypothetical protein TWF106_010003 [Orbilia oligospora]|uniref:Prokaryotic-type class I peptide chain release factors domain-containing protein n=2 Tax=Orbilia oligospora TaxID=2813651 RepID=A0A7C8KCB9_ORBOL|nr:hypothetical protein TWF788_011079 [Orbilia oligospora]KAF3199788.1 hypothetical protein TWF679_001186 [Orbilia oligospora]KAF3212229.1 hypothetical protein TWF106_010003 [Orbilia oligospora]